jgi:hypothetical protein
MKFSIEDESTKGILGENNRRIMGEEWEQVLASLPADLDLEASARHAGALLRRREVKSAADLLRMVFAYAVCDWSLRLVGAWCTLIGVGSLSDVAVMKRLCGCQVWLGMLITSVLATRRMGFLSRPGVRLRIMDGTTASQPGSTGTDWRLHLSFDLAQLCLDGVEVSDAQTGETFAHCPTRPGDIRLGDMGYAFPNSMGAVLSAEGGLVVRIHWQNIRLEWADGSPVDLIAYLQGTNKTQSVTEQLVYLSTPQGRFQLRLVCARLPQEAADKARHRLRTRYRKKGKTPDKHNLLAAGFTLLLTNLSAQEWTALQVLQLYRFRWQIELFIKRLKSILSLGQLRTQHPILAQVYLLGKILSALLLDEWCQQAQCCCPTWFTTPSRPVSPWRLTYLFFEGLRNSVRGTITLTMIFDTLPRLTRYFCDTPRKRTQQLAQARTILSSLSSC